VELEDFVADHEKRFAEREQRSRHAVPPEPTSSSGGKSVPIRDRRSPRRRSPDVSAAIAKTKGQITEARSARGPDFAKNAKVVDLVTAALKTRGQFFNDGLRSYFFVSDDRVLLPIERDDES